MHGELEKKNEKSNFKPFFHLCFANFVIYFVITYFLSLTF